MKKVYIVDDDKNIVDSLSMVLKNAGYEVGAQFDDRDVVENTARFGADLVILDVMFPEDGGLGFELARRYRTDRRTEKTPILMLSAINERHLYPGRFSNKDRNETWIPVEHFVDKPVAPKALLQKVDELLNKDTCSQHD